MVFLVPSPPPCGDALMGTAGVSRPGGGEENRGCISQMGNFEGVLFLFSRSGADPWAGGRLPATGRARLNSDSEEDTDTAGRAQCPPTFQLGAQEGTNDEQGLTWRARRPSHSHDGEWTTVGVSAIPRRVVGRHRFHLGLPAHPSSLDGTSSPDDGVGTRSEQMHMPRLRASR